MGLTVCDSPSVFPYLLRTSGRKGDACIGVRGGWHWRNAARGYASHDEGSLWLPVIIYGAPWGIRTHDLEIRSLLLYPTELRARVQ